MPDKSAVDFARLSIYSEPGDMRVPAPRRGIPPRHRLNMRIRASKDRMMKLFGYGVRSADSASAMRLASSHTVTPDVATSQPAKSEITEPETGISGETGNRGKQMRRIGKSAKFSGDPENGRSGRI